MRIYWDTAAAINAAADLSLAVEVRAEYPRARRSAGEPWVHLLVKKYHLDTFCGQTLKTLVNIGVY